MIRGAQRAARLAKGLVAAALDFASCLRLASWLDALCELARRSASYTLCLEAWPAGGTGIGTAAAVANAVTVAVAARSWLACA